MVVWVFGRERSCLIQMSLQGWVQGGCKHEEGAEEQLCWMDEVITRGRQ